LQQAQCRARSVPARKLEPTTTTTTMPMRVPMPMRVRVPMQVPLPLPALLRVELQPAGPICRRVE
jgi:hypothetical protein